MLLHTQHLLYFSSLTDMSNLFLGAPVLQAPCLPPNPLGNHSSIFCSLLLELLPLSFIFPWLIDGNIKISNSLPLSIVISLLSTSIVALAVTRNCLHNNIGVKHYILDQLLDFFCCFGFYCSSI
jgi:hypothetical protein